MEKNSFWRLFTLLIVAVMTCFACNNREASRQPVNKSALLKLIKHLAEAEGKHAPDISKHILRDYAKRYELVVVDSLFTAADSSMVQARVVHDKQFKHIDIQLPQKLEGQLTFADFAQVFGKGIESPRPKEPIGFSVMYLGSKVGDIRVVVQSHQPPDMLYPQIYQILIL